MAIINKNSVEIIQMARFRRNIYLTVEDKRFYFTRAAEKLCGFKVGEYIHFINDESEWSFYIDDVSDGFQLVPIPRGRGGALVCNVALVRLFRKSTGFSHVMSFEITETNNYRDNCRIFKINIVRPTDGKRSKRIKVKDNTHTPANKFIDTK